MHCDDCKRDISKSTRMLANQKDYCVSCFANLDDYPHFYHAIGKLDFPLFDPKWSADDELLLFEGLKKYLVGYLGMVTAIGEKYLNLSSTVKPHAKFRRTISNGMLNNRTSYPYTNSYLEK